MGGGGALSESLLSLVSSTNSFFFLLSSLSLVDPPMVMFPVISSVKERLKVMAAILFELLFDRHQQQENKEEEEEEGGLEGGKELSGPIFSLLSSMVGLFEKERGGDGVEEGGFFLKVVMVFKWFLERKPVSKKFVYFYFCFIAHLHYCIRSLFINFYHVFISFPSFPIGKNPSIAKLSVSPPPSSSLLVSLIPPKLLSLRYVDGGVHSGLLLFI